MINIQINEDVKLTSDKAGMNVQIEERIYKKDDIGLIEPTENFKVVGYYGSVPHAIKGLIKRGLNKSEASSFEGLISDMERIEKEIMSAVHQMNM
ncbi:hypothetical protein PBC1_035 [Bacillus phage PBC1]|uniref:Uncharacterized protein n=1 Tax=Bacillus phage PBC1 TaxID=1161901 RepID=I1TLG9_9CAUD|nr:replication initiation protein [Bacillus phage PBC1]AFE86271.1 hypothetical protein PBC1_035 [Bacillus phage PBC1]